MDKDTIVSTRHARQVAKDRIAELEKGEATPENRELHSQLRRQVDDQAAWLAEHGDETDAIKHASLAHGSNGDKYGQPGETDWTDRGRPDGASL